MPFEHPDVKLKAVLPRVTGEVKRMVPWQKPTGQRHHGRPVPEPYVGAAGRCEPIECTHSQFLDKEFGRTGWCLDCGVEIYVGRAAPSGVPWVVKEGGEKMDNDDLSRARHTFHAIWGIGPFEGLPPNPRRVGEYLTNPAVLPPAV